MSSRNVLCSTLFFVIGVHLLGKSREFKNILRTQNPRLNCKNIILCAENLSIQYDYILLTKAYNP